MYRHNNIQIVKLEVLKRKFNFTYYFPIFSTHKALKIKSANKIISYNYGLFKKNTNLNYF